MAYKTKFLHFKTKASYNTERNKTTAGSEARNIFDAYISFIAETKTICTRGNEYKCDISAEEVEELVISKKYITAADIPSLTGGAGPTTNQYVSGVTVSGHNVSVSKANLPAIPAVGTVVPKVAGTGTVGTSTSYSRQDHVHPAQVNITGNADTATKLSSARPFVLTGDVTGSTAVDLSGGVSISTIVVNDSHSHSNSTITSLDAAKITSGTIDIARLPQGALERMKVVATEAAAVAEVTSKQVQNGDTVQVTGNSNMMYYVYDDTKTTFATIFKVYTAGAASTVPWAGVTGKPNIPQGTVTSVGLSVPTGFTAGSAVSTSGNLSFSLANGYAIPTTTQINNIASGVTALAWGNHASAGYLKSVPVASSLELGLIKLGYTTSGKNYPIQLNTSNQAYVSVPWTDNNTIYSFASGTNGFTVTPSGGSAQTVSVTPSIANNITYTGNMVTNQVVTVSAGGVVKSSGFTIGSSVPSGAKFTDTTYGLATTSANGLMSAADKVKINSLATVASSGSYNDLSNKPVIPSAYTLPISTSTVLGGVKIGSNITVNNGTISLTNANIINALGFTPASENAYLPITGGTLTGNVLFQDGYGINFNRTGTNIYEDGIYLNRSTRSFMIAGGDENASWGVTFSLSGFGPIDVDYDLGDSMIPFDNIYGTNLYENGVAISSKYATISMIPSSLPNPSALTINGQRYDGSDLVNVITPTILTTAVLNSSTVLAGYNYTNTGARTITILSGFSATKPDTVIISDSKIAFTSSDTIKMDGLADLSGQWYIYCISYMSNAKYAVNGAVYAQ